MKTRITLLFVALGLLGTATSQNISLIFSATDTSGHVQQDSTKIQNQTTGEDTTLYYPDTVLTISNVVGIADKHYNEETFMLFQNFPNPVKDQTTITMSISTREKISLIVTDLLGRQIISIKKVLDKGEHNFSFRPGNAQLYFFTASTHGVSQSIKVLNANQGINAVCELNYQGSSDKHSQLKNTRAVQGFTYSFGDELLFIAYANGLQSGMSDSPETTTTYTFQFVTNIPCPGTPTITYGGQVYNTVQIFSQCWMKENLNVGNMLFVPEMQTDNDTIEKYCLGDMESYCDTYGGLYYWSEMMNYTQLTGGQGICPEGWHIPSDLDWQILEGAVDDTYHIGDTEWGNLNWRGNNAGGNLKQTGTSYWEPPNDGATNAYGFSTLPGGYFVQGAFWGVWYKAYLWSSDYNQKTYRNMDWNQIKIKKGTVGGSDELAISVRCIKNN